MNHIGYREFRKDLLEIFTDLQVEQAVLQSVFDDELEVGEVTAAIRTKAKMDYNMGAMTYIANIHDIMLPQYEDMGHLFPPFS